jgi:GGDEF domain-containing protein
MTIKSIFNKIIFRITEKKGTERLIKRRLEQLRGTTDPMLTFLGHDKSREELCYLAFVDRLTGVYNRNMLEEFRKKFDSVDIFVTIIDIDNLKMINDTKGHEEGDIFIKGLAEEISECSDWVFRLGGDEFLALNQSKIVFDMLGVSYGTIFKPSNMPLNEAMRTADFLMYKNKKERSILNEKRDT